jgi:hypothetical protein
MEVAWLSPQSVPPTPWGGPVPDEPTNGELARQLADIKQMLTGVVGAREYAADSRALDRRMGDIERDIAEERRDRVAALAAEKQERGDGLKAVNDRVTASEAAGFNSRQHWRTLLWTGALPAAVALLGILVTLYITHHGGSR